MPDFKKLPACTDICLQMGTLELLGLLLPTAGAVGLAYIALRQAALVRDLKDRIAVSSHADTLTGLINRDSFEDLLEKEVERSRRHGRTVSVVVGRVDRLALLVERDGDGARDAALCEIARDLERWKRRGDVAARIGAEEFALLLPEADEQGAQIMAERLRRAAHRGSARAHTPLTFSFGVATHPSHGVDAHALMRAADRALAVAVELGRDRTVVAAPEAASAVSLANGAPAELQLATVIALAEALDIRDTGTAKHSHMVGRYAELMAQELGLEPDRVERVRLAGILHDVGKIGVSDAVLSKPGPLSADEWVEMKTHPEIAARLLTRAEFDDVRGWILAHHERPDGCGYPFGLSGNVIPLEARVLAVADAFEAMTSDRVYRKALGEEGARAELRAGAGTQFDPAVVEALLSALEEQVEDEAEDASVAAG